MTDNSYLLDGNDRKKVNWFGRLLKITFIFAAFLLVIVTVLANMGGNSEMLKEAVAQFVSQSFAGRPVEVDKLNNMSFFPSVGVNVEGVHVISRPENGTKLLSIGKAQAYMGFWQVATQRPRFKTFYFENIHAIRGAIFPEEFLIHKVYIDHDKVKNTAVLRGEGKIGVHAWQFSAQLDVFGSGGKFSYMLSRNFLLNIQVSDITFDATLINHEDNYFKIEEFKLAQGAQSIGGNIVLSTLSRDLMKITADINMNVQSSQISADLIADLAELVNKYSGKVSSDKIVLTDILGEGSAFTILSRLRDIAGYTRLQQEQNPMAVLGQNNLDLELSLNTIKLPNNETVSLNAPLKLDQGHLKFAHLLAIPVEKEIVTITQNQTNQQDISFLKQYLPVIPEQMKGEQENCRIERAGEVQENITLDEFSYDFVQTVLQKSAENHSCAQRVSKTPEPDEETQSDDKADPKQP